MPTLEDMPEEERMRFARISHAALTHNDPAIRKQAKQLIKSMNPNWTDPELESDSLRAKLKEEIETPLRKEITELKEGLSKKDIEAEWQKAKERIEAAGDIKFDDVKKVMVDRKIADVDTAADFLRMQTQMATPTPAHVIPRELTPDVKKLLNNPTALRQHQQTNLRKAMDEVIANRRTGQPLKVA